MKSYNEGGIISHCCRSDVEYPFNVKIPARRWMVMMSHCGEYLYIPAPRHSCLSHKTTQCHRIKFDYFSCPWYTSTIIMIYGQLKSIHPLIIQHIIWKLWCTPHHYWSDHADRTEQSISLLYDLYSALCTEYSGPLISPSVAICIQWTSYLPPHHEQQLSSSHFLRHPLLHQPGFRSSTQHSRQTSQHSRQTSQHYK